MTIILNGGDVKTPYGCPANYKLIPYLVQGVCRHWVWLTGDK